MLLFSHSVMSNSLWPHGLQHTRLPCPSLSTEVCLDSCPWVSDAIRPSHPLSSPLLLPLIFASISLFQSGCSHQVAKGLQFQHQSFQWRFRVDFLQDWLVWSPCSPRDSQESSLAPQFESINSLVLSLLYMYILLYLIRIL